MNGIDLHEHPEKVEGIVGFIPQDDLLMEDLTVFQNLFFAAQLCFGNLEKDQIVRRVENVLTSLGRLSDGDIPIPRPAPL